MSKYYWERSDSSVAFIYNARRIAVRISETCANANRKKYTFYGGQELAHTSRELVKQLRKVNRINPRSRAEADARRILLAQARGLLDDVVDTFGELAEKMQISAAVMQEISDMMEKEDRLLAGLQKSDLERFKAIK